MSIDLAFYNAGCENSRGARRFLVLARRALRRVLRPIFQHLAAILQNVCDRLDAAERADAGLRTDLDALARRHEDLRDQLQATIAFGWDYVALVRRVAVLEDRVETLMAAIGDESRTSLPFPAADGRAEAC
jgi:hypothetical protein